MFVLGCFIDFFEIAFIVIPLLAPVAEKILPGLVPGMTPDDAMIWFGVIIAMNLQTSFRFVLLATLAIKFILAWILPMSGDEAYFIVWAKHPDFTDRQNFDEMQALVFSSVLEAGDLLVARRRRGGRDARR